MKHKVYTSAAIFSRKPTCTEINCPDWAYCCELVALGKQDLCFDEEIEYGQGRAGKHDTDEGINFGSYSVGWNRGKSS